MGAEGNNGGGQAGSSQTDNGGNAKPPAQETQPAETEQESSVEENTEESTSETEETIQPLESVDNTEGTGSESESEDSDRNQNSEETRDPDRVIEAPSETVEKKTGLEFKIPKITATGKQMHPWKLQDSPGRKLRNRDRECSKNSEIY